MSLKDVVDAACEVMEHGDAGEFYSDNIAGGRIWYWKIWMGKGIDVVREDVRGKDAKLE